MTTGLGDRIKRLRLARDLTLKEVGARARVSSTHLSEIERGRTSPTVGALVRIAAALGEEASRLVEDTPSLALALVRAAERRVLVEDGVVLEPLSGAVGPCELSVLAVTLPPGAELPRLAHAGEQFILVVGGAVEVAVAPGAQALREGDAIHFAACDCQGVRNRADRPAQLVWVASPPAVW